MTSPPSERPFPGLPLRYRVLRELGRGREKRVHLADDTLLGRAVAIAEVDPDTVGESGLELLHEARAMARVGDHANVVSVYDVIDHADTIYIVSQYLSGGDLAELLRGEKHGLPLRRALQIGAQVCRALEHAHANGVAHRDLKPGNVLLDERGNAFVGDFGLAHLAGPSARPAGDEVVGTPLYMAPEQVRGEGSGPGEDLYALGCLLYELVTGAPPFVGNVQEAVRLHQSTRPRPLASRNPGMPPALDDLVLQLLEKDPADRPASARDAREALEGILESALPLSATGQTERSRRAAERRAAAGEPPIVAREAELGALDRAIERALGGEARVVLVSGQAGVGKSRLLRASRARAEGAGAVMLLGQGYEDLAFPYKAFVEALRPLAGRLAERPPRDAARLRDLLQNGRGASGLERDGVERHRLFVTVFEALAAWSQRRPLVLVLDDLHWADSASLDLFEQLAVWLLQRPREPQIRVALVAGFRPPAAGSRLARSVAHLEREPDCETLEVEPLGEHGTFELLEALGVKQPSDRLVQTVHAETQGNPLFVSAVVRSLARRGALESQGDRTVGPREVPGLDVPPSVRQALAVRVRDVSPSCRRALSLASALGGRFELTSLVAVSEDPEERLFEAVEEAVAAGLVIDEGHAYRFEHPLVRHVLYHDASATRRQRLHRQVAERLEASGAQQREGGVLQIAHHLVRAGPAADPAKALAYAQEAGDLALARFAWSEAAELFEAALSSPVAEQALSVGERAELHRRAGHAYYWRSDTAPSVRHFRAAIEGFQSVGDVLGEARTRIDQIRIAEQTGQVPPGTLGDVEPLERLVDRLPASERSLRARLMGTLAEAYWVGGQSARADALASEAVQLAEEAGDSRVCVQTGIQLALARWQALRVEEALSSLRGALAHARKADDLLGAVQCLQRIPIVLLMAGRLDEAERFAHKAREENALVQSPGEASLAFSVLAVLSIVRGDTQAAERHADEALYLIRRTRNQWSGALLLPALACARAMRGDRAGAHDAIELFLQPGLVFDDPTPFASMMAPYRPLVDGYVGEPAGEPGPFPAPADPADADGAVDFAAIPGICAEIELRDLLQAEEPPTRAAAALQTAERHGIAFTMGWPFFVPRVQGVAALLERRWDDAEHHFQRATEQARSIAAPPELARSQLDYARMLAIRNGPGDRRRALDLLDAANPELDRRCPEAFRRRAEKLTAFLQEELLADRADEAT